MFIIETIDNNINDEYCSKNLYKVTLSDKTITIGYLCFKNRNLLNEFEIIESGSIKIGKNQFTNCSNLEKISIQSLTEIEYVNSSIIEFGISCFIGAINLTKFVLTGDN